MAILTMSAALPWIGELTAIRSAPLFFSVLFLLVMVGISAGASRRACGRTRSLPLP